MDKPNLQYKQFVGEVKSWDDQTLTIEHFISTEMQDSVGDIMLASGMKMRGIPVVLFLHGLDPKFGHEPIASAVGISVGTNKSGVKGIVAKTKYYDGSKLNPPDSTGQRLYDKAKNNVMPNWSIGFNSVKERPTKGGRIVEEWELFEYSQVSVACNEQCTTLAGDVPEVKFMIIEKSADGAVPDKKPEGETPANPSTPAEPEKPSPESDIAGKIAHAKCHSNLKLVHEGMVQEMYHKCYDEKCKDFESDDIAKAIVADAANLHHGHTKEFIDYIRKCSSGKSGAEIKSFIDMITIPTITPETKAVSPVPKEADAAATKVPVIRIKQSPPPVVPVIKLKQSTPAVNSVLPLHVPEKKSGTISLSKAELETLLNSAVKGMQSGVDAEIKKAQGKITT